MEKDKKILLKKSVYFADKLSKLIFLLNYVYIIWYIFVKKNEVDDKKILISGMVIFSLWIMVTIFITKQTQSGNYRESPNMLSWKYLKYATEEDIQMSNLKIISVVILFRMILSLVFSIFNVYILMF